MATYWDALTGVLAKVLATPTFASYSASQYAIRSRPFCSMEHGDVLPFLCVSGEWESLHGEWDQFDGAAGLNYPVMVSWFLSRGGEVQDATRMQLVYQGREEIRTALWQPKILSNLQVDATYDPNPAFDRAALEKQFQLSLQRFVFTYVEER